MTLSGPKGFMLKNREIFFYIFMSGMTIGERLNSEIGKSKFFMKFVHVYTTVFFSSSTLLSF